MSSKIISKKEMLNLYAMMLKIRLFEEEIVSVYPQQQMRTPVHLCLGEEAIAAGIGLHLKKDDVLFSNHRCHGHCIAKGLSLETIMAELYGKAQGCCRGKGGSMHLADPNFGVYSTSAIVAGGIPMAVGAAWSLKLRKKKSIAVTFFGDGATDQGVFYESLSFAALKKIPVLFVCENNFYATNSHQRSRQPRDNIYKKGSIFGIKGYRLDGNDALKVYSCAKDAIAQIRKKGCPVLLECRTYRWKGHVGPDCDVEKGCRPRHEFNAWLKKCPVGRFENYLMKQNILTKNKKEQLLAKIVTEIEKAQKFAFESPEPSPKALFENVYF